MPASTPSCQVVTAMCGRRDSHAIGGTPSAQARLSAWVDGWVQGVGFRWWVRSHALNLGLSGSATNLPDGRVEILAQGPRPALEELLALLRGPAAPGRVADVTARWSEPCEGGPPNFVAR